MLSNLKTFNFPRSSYQSLARDYDYSPFSGWKRDYDWSPFASFRREVDRLFHDFSRATTYGGYGQTETGFTGYWPAVDVSVSANRALVSSPVGSYIGAITSRAAKSASSAAHISAMRSAMAA